MEKWKMPMASIEFDDGVCFSVDFINKRLCDYDIPGNIIKLSDLEDKATHYEFYYNKDKRNIGLPISKDGSDSETIFKVKINQLTGINPQAMAAIYGVDLPDLEGKPDQQFFADLPGIRERQWEHVQANSDQLLLNRRLAGELPGVNIGNERFLFDCERGIFQHVNKEHVKIEIEKMQPTPERDGFACFVDAWDCSPVYENVAAFGLHMLAHLKIPDPVLIDPVGVARLRGFKDTDLLYRYPLQDKPEMKITALSERAANTIKNKVPNPGNEKNQKAAIGRRQTRL